MENIRVKVNDAGKLLLVIDPKVKGEATQSGKATKIAWTNRFEKLEIDGMPKGNFSIMVMLTKQDNKKKTSKANDEDEDDNEEGYIETKTKNKCKRPNVNRDANGKVKLLASSNRPSDKLKTKRAKT
jgi:hypothetical protein